MCAILNISDYMKFDIFYLKYFLSEIWMLVSGSVSCLICLVVIMVSLAFVWSHDDLMYTNLILNLLPQKYRARASETQKVFFRKYFQVLLKVQ